MERDDRLVLDRAHLAGYSGGDTALEAELFGLLEAQIAACLEKLKTAKDAQSWLAAAHTLKGAARGVGAMALGAACAAAEDAPLSDEALEAVAAEAERARAAIAG